MRRLDLTDLATLGVATSAMAFYVASSSVVKEPRTYVQRHVRKNLIRVMHRAAEDANRAAHSGTTVPIKVQAETHFWKWLAPMVVPDDVGDSACRQCVGQWCAFVIYGLAVGGPPWRWGWRGWIEAVALNGVHLMALQATFIDLGGDLNVELEQPL